MVRINKEKWKGAIQPTKYNSDENEAFLCFHSERCKLRRKKESTV